MEDPQARIVRWRAKPYRPGRRTPDVWLFARFPGVLRWATRSLLALPPGSRRRRRLLERAYRQGFHANATGRTAETLAFFHPDVELFISSDAARIPAGTERRYAGYEGFARFFELWTEMWAEWRLELEEFFDLGDRLVLTGTTVGHGLRSGIELRQEQAGIWTFSEGRCSKVELFWSHAEALEAAGLETIAAEYGAGDR